MVKLIDLLRDKGINSKKAEQIIRAGFVKVNGQEIILPNEKVSKNVELFIKKEKKYVSRGAYKLLKAFQAFDICVNGKITLDIGSSTGGFTEVLLEKGSKKVYAVDVGTNQLDFSLRRKKNVISLEKTNLKKIKKDFFDEIIELVVADVSFISVKEVFKVLKNTIQKNTKVIILIKPQFEAFQDQVKNGGFVPKKIHHEIIGRVQDYACIYGFKYINHVECPIKGNKAKNTEYISLFVKG